MSDINVTYNNVYESTIYPLLESKGGKFRSGVEFGMAKPGEKLFFEQVGGFDDVQEMTVRFADSPAEESSHERRMVTIRDFNHGFYVSKLDLRRVIADPRSDLMQKQALVFGRKEDRVVQQGLLGQALGGKDGTTALNLGAGQKIDVTLGATSGNAGMTYEKLVKSKEILMSNDVDLDEDELYISISPQQWQDLMLEEEFKNFDYNEQRTLQRGDFLGQKIMGMNWIMSTQIPYINTAGTGVDFASAWSGKNPVDYDTTDIRACAAWVKSGLRLKMRPDVKVRVTEREDKSFEWYAYAEAGYGAVRMEEEKVVQIPCDQSPA